MHPQDRVITLPPATTKFRQGSVRSQSGIVELCVCVCFCDFLWPAIALWGLKLQFAINHTKGDNENERTLIRQNDWQQSIDQRCRWHFHYKTLVFFHSNLSYSYLILQSLRIRPHLRIQFSGRVVSNVDRAPFSDVEFNYCMAYDDVPGKTRQMCSSVQFRWLRVSLPETLFQIINCVFDSHATRLSSSFASLCRQPLLLQQCGQEQQSQCLQQQWCGWQSTQDTRFAG